MTDWVSWGASSLVIATALGAAGWLTARRGHPTIGHALIALALLELVTPPLWSIPLFPTVPVIIEPGAAFRAAADVVLPHSTGSVDPAAVAWTSWIALAWLLGTLVTLSVHTSRFLRLGRRVASMRPAPAAITSELDVLARRLGLRRAPAARVVEANVAPMICPTTRGLRLVLPARLLATLSPEARTTVLIHELAHVRRGDWAVRFLETAAVAVWWWMPLVFWLRRELRRTEELCCDAWVASEMPRARESYAEALVATTALVERVPSPASGLGPVEELEQRIEMLQNPSPRTIGRAGRVALLAVLVGVLPVVACHSPAEVSVAAPSNDDRHAFVMGAVEEDRRIDVTAGDCTVLDALSAAKTTADADRSRVVLVRPEHEGSPVLLTIDVESMLRTGATERNVLLQPRDIVYVARHSDRNPMLDASQFTRPLINKSTIEKGDDVRCLVEPSLTERSGMELLEELKRPQRIGEEGTILVPYVGSLKVDGLTTTAATELINERLGEFFAIDLHVQVRASEAR